MIRDIPKYKDSNPRVPQSVKDVGNYMKSTDASPMYQAMMSSMFKKYDNRGTGDISSTEKYGVDSKGQKISNRSLLFK